MSCSVNIDLKGSVEEIVECGGGKDEEINILRRLEKGVLDEIEIVLSCVSQLLPKHMPIV